MLFEFSGKPQETKKSSLDAFVKMAGREHAKLELAARRSFDALQDLATIFLPKDRLLSSAGVLPVYYWFIRQLKQSQYPTVREFLNRFEEERKTNRKKVDAGGTPSSVDRQLVEYDQFNRSTNDLASHLGRVEILKKRFAKFSPQ